MNDNALKVFNYEHESTFRVKIEKPLYDAFVKNFLEQRPVGRVDNSDGDGSDNHTDGVKEKEHVDDSTNAFHDRRWMKNRKNENFKFGENIIIVFDDGKRLSERRYEMKCTEQKQYAATFYKNKLYLVTRAMSTERLLPACKRNEVGNVIKTTHRYVLYPKKDHVYSKMNKLRQKHRDTMELHIQNKNQEYDWSDEYVDKMRELDPCVSRLKFRLSFDNETSNDNCSYYLTCEVEYEKNANIRDVYIYENFMIYLFEDYVCDPEVMKMITFETVANTELFESVKPKIQLYSKFDQSSQFVWAPKWNGVSAKFVKLDDRVQIWPDLSPLQTINITSGERKKFSIINNCVLQVEILNNFIVIVHIISIKMNGKLHYVDLYNNLSFLRYIYKQLHGQRLGSHTVLVQRFVKSKLPVNFDMENGKYDGLIIYQNNQYIKWKQPTVDAMYTGDNQFFVGNNKRYELIKCPEDCSRLNVGKVYELSSKLEVLRERLDRAFCATWEEYVGFVNNVELLTKM